MLLWGGVNKIRKFHIFTKHFRGVRTFSRLINYYRVHYSVNKTSKAQSDDLRMKQLVSQFLFEQLKLVQK